MVVFSPINFFMIALFQQVRVYEVQSTRQPETVVFESQAIDYK
jgi:hypothetical protein